VPFFLPRATVFSAQAQALKGDVQAGERNDSMRMGCHGIVGYQATFPEVHKVPKIAGQSAKYIVSMPSPHTRAGERKHPSMRGIARLAERAGYG
jgi:cytochrome c553